MNNTIKPAYYLILIFGIGITFRLYNINFDDLWLDEILTFWIANPYDSLSESFANHRTIEQVPFLFNLITKIYFEIFGYDVYIARFIPALCSILSLLVIFFLSKILSSNNAYIFSTFLVSFNIFLISYSQELRVYSSLFLFNSLSILFFFKIIKTNRILTNVLFSISSIISILLHPFSFIVIFSYINYLIFLYSKGQKFKYLYISLLSVILVFIIYYFFLYSIKYSGTPSWITLPDIKFFTNFYFSKFFGSRLVGLIHLIILLYLMSCFFIYKIKKDYIIFFSFLIIYSYLLPLAYSFIFSPIILARYIIFVLIPIIIIISHLTFEMKKNKKKILIFIITITTIGNLYTEQTVQQFIKERWIYKPQFNKSLSIINKSDYKKYKIKIKDEVLTKISAEKALKNYIDHLSQKKNYDLEYLKFDNSFNDSFWSICLYDLNDNNCTTNNSSVKKIIRLNRVEIILNN